MKILVYGTGAIGSLMIHFLCRAGNDVTVVARSSYNELSKNGLIIRHKLQGKTTVDHPKIVKEAESTHYDIVFSVMQGQQQKALLHCLRKLDTDLIVLVGNNMETTECSKALVGKHVLYGFQDSAGHREHNAAVVGRLPVTGLNVGRLHKPAPQAYIDKLRKAFDVKGCKVTNTDSMYAYYMYHIAELMPYCYLCYDKGCNLKKADMADINRIMQASRECFDYLRAQDIPVMPKGEEKFYDGGISTAAMRTLYFIMAKTVLGELMVSDHCKNGIAEMKYLDDKFEEYRREHSGPPMPVWDRLRRRALKAWGK